jgi:outer membrane protein OmpA-like peptidoglycan-associated protein
VLAVAPSSPEADLAQTLADVASPLPRAFRFDDLQFDIGRASLRPDSSGTIDNLATTLQAYPSARIRVEGHADNTGDLAADQTLAQSRAEALKGALVAKGIAAERIETKGPGPVQPSEGAAGNEPAPGGAAVLLVNR